MALISQPMIDNSDRLRIGGAFIAIFSVAMGALILFAIPIACTFVGSIQLLLLGLLFLAGCATLLIGIAAARKRKSKL